MSNRKKKVLHSEPKTRKQAAAWTKESGKKLIKTMDETTKEYIGCLQRGELIRPTAATRYDGYHVPFLDGNGKIGTTVKTISLRPVIDCANCHACRQDCYDLRHDVIQTACREYRCITAAILEHDPERFWQEVEAQMKFIMLLRLAIGGDWMKKREWMEHWVKAARLNPHCQILCFTKSYDVVNEWMDENGELPENLHILFSAWPDTPMDNRHNLPISFPKFAKDDIENDPKAAEFAERMPLYYWHCNDDCTQCALAGEGCWTLQRGQAVGFNFH